MYHNQIIVLIKKDGQPLRETEGKFVYLPFNSEYSIELKNQSYRRAVASIKIDGTDVLGGDEIIIPAQSSVNVERFITNGNLSKGRKLKFVPLSDSKVQDPSSPENGLIEIECWFEKPQQITWTSSASTWPPHYIGSSPSWVEYNYNNSSTHESFGAINMVNCCMPNNYSSAIRNMSVGQAGATVEGGKSDQSFSHGSFGQKDYPSVTFKFWLRGVEKEVTTEDKLYCTSCGKKTRFDYKYCPRCGSPVQIA